jgi:hypothetical protein
VPREGGIKLIWRDPGSGTVLAIGLGVMAASVSSAAKRVCQWTQIEGARVRGRSCTSTVWVCEFPYRTIRRSGPDAACSDCPAYEALQKEKARAATERADADRPDDPHPIP